MRLSLFTLKQCIIKNIYIYITFSLLTSQSETRVRDPGREDIKSGFGFGFTMV